MYAAGTHWKLLANENPRYVFDGEMRKYPKCMFFLELLEECPWH